VVRSAPDGYTLLLEAGANVINDTLFDKLGFNFIRDIAPVAGLIAAPLIMELNPSVPARTVPEFIAYAKANPGKINMASAGNGTPQHVCGELFKMMAGVDMIHVPYRGAAPAVTNLLGGQVQVMFDTPPASIEHIRAGKLRPLAVTSATRASVLPDVPLMSDFLPGFEATAWYAKKCACRDRGKAQSGNQRRSHRSRHQGATGGFGRQPPGRFSSRFRHVPAPRIREVGQGDQIRRHQAGRMIRHQNTSRARVSRAGGTLLLLQLFGGLQPLFGHIKQEYAVSRR
jgi:hypothetical protein